MYVNKKWGQNILKKLKFCEKCPQILDAMSGFEYSEDKRKEERYAFPF